MHRFVLISPAPVKVKPESRTSAVSDTEAIYKYLCNVPEIESARIGILGFSQGARVMAEFWEDSPIK